jgi:hypothetical protein
MHSSDTSRSSTNKPTHITPDILIENMTVSQIDNLATAFHYFVWPANPVDHGFTHHYVHHSDMNEIVEAIKYSQGLGLNSQQVDIFYCQVANCAIKGEPSYWLNKHDRIAAEYTYMQNLRYQREWLFVSVEWFNAACNMQLLWNN